MLLVLYSLVASSLSYQLLLALKSSEIQDPWKANKKILDNLVRLWSYQTNLLPRSTESLTCLNQFSETKTGFVCLVYGTNSKLTPGFRWLWISHIENANKSLIVYPVGHIILCKIKGFRLFSHEVSLIRCTCLVYENSNYYHLSSVTIFQFQALKKSVSGANDTESSNILHSFFFYKNIFCKNIEAEIWEISRIF